MKSILKVSAVILFVAFMNIASAQSNSKKQTAVIQTSAICESCKTRIETNLLEMKGVISADLNLTDKKVTVIYNPTKTSIDDIRKKISSIGYDADDVKRDETAFKNLPSCCKNEEEKK